MIYGEMFIKILSYLFGCEGSYRVADRGGAYEHTVIIRIEQQIQSSGRNSIFVNPIMWTVASLIIFE